MGAAFTANALVDLHGKEKAKKSESIAEDG